MIEKISKNIHAVRFDKKAEYLLISDVHFDNPHCDRDLLRKHLDEAKRRGAKVLVNGDFFCLMQGRGDPRRSKDEIRAEHNRGNYIDSVIDEAVEWWKPYADMLLLIGYGNHETGVIKHQETDVLARFADLMRYKYKSPVQVGGYGGVVMFQGQRGAVYIMKYFHGSGGGGVVTKGVIQNQRMMAYTEGYDLIWQGHVHELYHHRDMVEKFDRFNHKIKLLPVDHVRTSTYKEEYEDGAQGFHGMRGAPPKPMGGYWLSLTSQRKQNTQWIESVLTMCV